MTIIKPLREFAVQQPNKPAIITKNRNITYGCLYQRINRISRALMDKQIPSEKVQQKVGILLGNRTEFLEFFISAAAIGAVAVVFDTKWTAKDLTGKIKECQPDILITESAYADKLGRQTSETKMVWVDHPDDEQWLRSFSDKPLKKDVPGDALFYMGFTSGTTGDPKGFLRTQDSWVETFRISNVEFGISKDDHILSPGPFVHSLSLYAAVYSLFIGATFYMEPSFRASSLLALFREYPISVVYVVPTMLKSILHRAQGLDHWPDLRKIISSGDKLDASTKEKFSLTFSDVDLYEYYGASELSFVTVLDPTGNREKPDSVGRPFENVTISIRDKHGHDVPPGQVGTLYVKSPMVFSHYFGNPEETAKVLRNGWATVGDIAYQDDKGYIYLVGRKKNMIIGGGLNIYPAEVEKLLLQHPEVQEAVVVGVKDRFWGEKVVAAITGHGVTEIDERSVRRFCRERLSRYKNPRRIHLFEQFPYTSSGKIAREKVKQMILTREDEVR
ncbi:MAG TPA: AMP-binding protein [Bacillales bacterium]|nr:AMP-binding protein [Bacillales bacterium]